MTEFDKWFYYGKLILSSILALVVSGLLFSFIPDLIIVAPHAWALLIDLYNGQELMAALGLFGSIAMAIVVPLVLHHQERMRDNDTI